MIDQVAEREVLAADLAVDGRGDAGEVQVEAMAFQGGHGGGHGGKALLLGRLVFVQVLLAHGAGFILKCSWPARCRPWQA